MPTNDNNQHTGNHAPPTGDFVDHPNPGRESAKLGYETTDVNTGGVVVFIGGLFGFVLIFFVFCFFMGRVINEALNKQDGPADKWHQGGQMFAGAKATGGKRENLKSKRRYRSAGTRTDDAGVPRAAVADGRRQPGVRLTCMPVKICFWTITAAFPDRPSASQSTGRWNSSYSAGLPVAGTQTQGQLMAGDARPEVKAPLTSGFARTGYELDTMGSPYAEDDV